MAPSVIVLDFLRAAQGVAAAAALSGGSAALAQEFEGHARTKAFSALGTTFGAGLAFGPLLAGLLIETAGWCWSFLSSAVVGALALAFGAPRMRESRDPNASQLDWPGMATFTAALTLFTFGVIQGPESGWRSLEAEALLLGSIIMLAAFIIVETCAAQPMLDLSLFRYARFVGVQTLPIATCYCYVVLLVLLPLRFIGVEGHSPIGVGLLLLALSAPMLVIGFGAGLPWGLMDGLSVSVVPKERAGMAAGIFSTTRVAGEGIALLVVTAMLSGLTQYHFRVLGLPVTSSLRGAAQRLASGDVDAASRMLPGVGREVLVRSYAMGFQQLSYFLIGVTIVASIAAFVFLRQKSPTD